MIKIDSFSGPYRYLSNFYPVLVLYEGHIYPSIEHAFQAAKTHPSQRAPFRSSSLSAGEAKRLGRKVNLDQDWEKRKVAVMAGLIACKFSATSLLAKNLLHTGEAELVEGNTWGDTFWGVCRGVGQNQLGVLLMARREKLRTYGWLKHHA